MPDRYSYPNSLVLINKLGITDYDRWKAVETAAIHQRMVELTEHPIPGRYDLAHLQAIHRHLTAELYVWGGAHTRVPIWKWICRCGSPARDVRCDTATVCNCWTGTTSCLPRGPTRVTEC